MLSVYLPGLANRLIGKTSFLITPFFIFGAPGGIGALTIATGTSPVPFTAIAQKNIHSQCLFYP